MRAPPILATRRAVVRHLKADAILTATAVGDRIYGERPPASGLLWPFVRCDGFDALPGWRVAGLIHIFSKGPFSDEAAQIIEVIADSVGDQTLDLQNGYKAFIGIERVRVIPDGGEQDAWHGFAAITASIPRDCVSV